jgi:hypothetical protein
MPKHAKSTFLPDFFQAMAGNRMQRWMTVLVIASACSALTLILYTTLDQREVTHALFTGQSNCTHIGHNDESNIE